MIPWSPLAGGLLTGKYKEAGKGPAGSRYADKAAPFERDNARAFGVVEQFVKLAEEKSKSLSPDDDVRQGDHETPLRL